MFRRLFFWPSIFEDIASSISERYVNIAGRASIELPLKYEGPLRNTWQDIARHTLSLANKIENLEELGVDPLCYDPQEYRSLGIFLRQIGQDFNRNILSLRSELEKPVSIIIVFASESNNPGVLSQLTSPAHYGLLDAHALISVTSQSTIGKWWAQRRGLLTRTIVQLNARAICLAPTAAASCIRNISDKMDLFDKIGYRRYGPARAVRDLGRSDLGKIVLGEKVSRFESRGTPGDDGSTAFSLLSESGFNLGKDKNLNGIMAGAIDELLKSNNIEYERVSHEKKLGFCSLIPDNSIQKSEIITCIEYTWRTGDFLSSSNRSSVAQYILTKLKNYARELNWYTE